MTRGGARLGAGRPKSAEKTIPIRVPERMLTSIQNFVASRGHQLPLYTTSVAAGAPEFADDSSAEKLDLNTLLVKRPTATFLVRVSGESMINAGIHNGDILIVDQSTEPRPEKIVVASIDGQLTVKRLKKNKHGEMCLMPENPDFQPILLTPENTVTILGVVVHVIHSV